jgi:predicted N-acyltransferase
VTPSEDQWRLEFRRSFAEIEPAQWDRLAGPSNPFVSHGFLSALEDSGCVGQGTAWLPFPALLSRASGPPLAAAPAFVKLDSTGEYVFDYSWAEAYSRLFGQEGGSYYPKLQIAVPFTPVPGPRLLVDPDLEASLALQARSALLNGFLQLAQGQNLSSVHLTFGQEGEVSLACQQGAYLHRLGEQYHWINEGYGSFESFLDSLSSRKRKAIRRERRVAQSHPVSFHTVPGDQATPEQWDALFAMYIRTAREKWGQPYLNREFFRLLARRLGQRVVLFLVRREPTGTWIAGAWNLRGNDALYGRNWGCLENFDMLHFEVCYYRAIEYAIAHGLARVEAGAQGFHKIQRGYRPVAVHSAHYLREPAFAAIIANYLSAERQEERQRLAALAEMTPFRKAAV